jgi:hypothetical protein
LSNNSNNSPSANPSNTSDAQERPGPRRPVLRSGGHRVLGWRRSRSGGAAQQGSPRKTLGKAQEEAELRAVAARRCRRAPQASAAATAPPADASASAAGQPAQSVAGGAGKEPSCAPGRRGAEDGVADAAADDPRLSASFRCTSGRLGPAAMLPAARELQPRPRRAQPTHATYAGRAGAPHTPEPFSQRDAVTPPPARAAR